MESFKYDKFFKFAEATLLKKYIPFFEKVLDENFYHSNHGNFKSWISRIESIPDVLIKDFDFRSDAIKFGNSCDCSAFDIEKIKSVFKHFYPWRKGPFSILGIDIDAEWRSDFKWNRIVNSIVSLKGRTVLDVGCGNGYHLWRILGEGAQLAFGIDLTMIYVMQFHLINKFALELPISVIPMSVDLMPSEMNAFDTVFSMGVLYHRKQPIEHIRQLSSFLKDDGELVLETLAIDGEKGDVLVPKGKYAKMPNVRVVPSCLTIELWLKEAGFKNIKLVDYSGTTIEEQRVTEWMGTSSKIESLKDFLDATDPDLTVEGYPAPKRAIFIADKK